MVLRMSEKSVRSDKIIRIATRSSPLALWQAHYVQQYLMSRYEDYQIELIPIVTRGDDILDTTLSKIGGKGLFVKELELALLENKADIAVHSMKDLPGSSPEGLGLVAICQRDDPRDALICKNFQHIDALTAGSVVGTSSLRRQCQLLARRPDLIVRDLRGNVGTRLMKLEHGEFDAIILATAGLKRLRLDEKICYPMSIVESLPAAGQCAIGIQCRLKDSDISRLLAPLNHRATEICISAERAMNARLGGGCQVPIGSYAELRGNRLWLRGLVGAPDGSRIIRGERVVHGASAKQTGIDLAHELLSRGAGDILSFVCQQDNN